MTAALAGPIGGASGDAGVEYRRAVAAYAVAHALAGEPLSGFGFALAQAHVVAVAVETDDYADDVRITFRGGHRAQVQAKRSLRFDAKLRSAVAQWIPAAKAGLDTSRDRLVLATGTANGPVTLLARALARCKTDEPGTFTRDEQDHLGRLDELLSELSEAQRKLVHRCAVITVLDVEEEQAQDASLARLLLGRVVGDGGTAVHAWRDLVAHCGRVGRLRGGFSTEGWVRQLQDDRYRITGSGTPAAEIAHRAGAVDRYRDRLRSRGTTVDLLSLGADVARIPLKELDASVDCVPTGSDRRDAEQLAWSLLRRSRVLLTGLPGGGKSVAVAAAAAVLVDTAGAPLPLVVSLRDVDARCRSQGFADRILDAAVKDVPAADRVIVREVLEQGLTSGATALLLDSLDETHDRRGAVVSEVAELCAQVSPAVPMLLATRDVAYAQASTLGWDDVRLIEPREPERAARAVLQAVAANRHIGEADSWVEQRIEWVRNVLRQDRAIRETPLLPVLLALLAADSGDGKLPTVRAQILYKIVEAAVRRREARRDPDLRIGTLSNHDSANAMLASFAVEAGTLGEGGGQALLATAREMVTEALVRDWGLAVGIAESAASAIIHFWDEIGIFVIRGAEETIVPRIELFLDIGDAIRAKKLSPQAAAAWVDARIRNRRYEPLILGAALSAAVSERLITAVCESGRQELLLTAATAVQQHALVTDEDRNRLLLALAEDAARPSGQGWESCAMMLRLIDEKSPIPDLDLILENYGSEHQTIARAALTLARPSNTSLDESLLADVLRVRRLPRPRVPRKTTLFPRFRIDRRDIFHEEILERAAGRLLGQVEEATGLVVDLLSEVSDGLNERLIEALRKAGLNDAAHAAIAEKSRMFKRAVAGLEDYDKDTPIHILDHLALPTGADLTVTQASRLDEIADLYQTLELDGLSAWPKSDEFSSWLSFVDIIFRLGGFDPARISSEARITRERVAKFGPRAFYALNIKSKERKIDRWSNIENPDAAVDSLTDALYKGTKTAFVAAVALSTAPPEVAIPSLESALPRLRSSREHQRLAGHALACLKADDTLAEWAVSENAALRLVAAEALPNTLNERLNPLLCSLTHDMDREVADAAIRSIADARIPAAAEHLTIIATMQPKDWTCARCQRINPATVRGCSECQIVPPDPMKVAGELLAEIFGDESFIQPGSTRR